MPWEKDFDVEEAVDQAMGVFRSKGYKATSITDLSNAMNLNKGSIYNAYGSKKALFLRALDKYDREKRQATLAQLENMDDPLGSIRALFEGLVEESEQDSDRAGCLLVNTSLDLPNHDEDVRSMVTDAMKDFEAFFTRQLKKAAANGSLPKSVDPAIMAPALLSHVIGIRVLARGVLDQISLAAIRDHALQQINA